MRKALSLSVVLLFSPPMLAATLVQTTPVPGHAAGSFGRADQPFGVLAGGAAWSADGRLVYTLDTTRTLKRWRASDGQLLATQTLQPPAALPASSLILSGAAGAQGLPLLANGSKGGQPASFAYRQNISSGQVTQQAGCLFSLRTLLTCTPDGPTRAWIEGGELRWQRSGKIIRQPLPAGLTPQLRSGHSSAALALSTDGTRVALLVLQSKDVDFGGQGVLLTWALASDGSVTAEKSTLKGPRVFLGATLHWIGDRVLLASNVFQTNNEYGGGGARAAQQLGLYTRAGQALWTYGSEVGLRGAWPSPDGQLFVTFRDGNVPEMRRIQDGRLVRSLGEAVLDAVPLSGGRALLAIQSAGGRGRIALHQQGNLRTLYQGRATVLTSSNDGRHFASAFGKTVRLHDKSGKVLREWQAVDKGRVAALAFSPEGGVLSVQSDLDAKLLAWKLDGTPLRLPAGAQFPVSSVVLREEGRKDGPQKAFRRRWLASSLEGKALWQTPWHSNGIFALHSGDGHWLAGFGLTQQTVDVPEPGQESSRVNTFARVEARTGKSGPPVRVKVERRDDVYAGWSLQALDHTGRLLLLGEGSGDGCGGRLYGYKLADLQTGHVLNTPTQLQTGYGRFMGCGFQAFRPRAAFALDDRLLIQDGNRLDWWTF